MTNQVSPRTQPWLKMNCGNNEADYNFFIQHVIKDAACVKDKLSAHFYLLRLSCNKIRITKIHEAA